MKKNNKPTKRELVKLVQELDARISRLENMSNATRIIGPKPGQCGMCGDIPCSCEQSRRDFEEFLKTKKMPSFRYRK